MVLSLCANELEELETPETPEMTIVNALLTTLLEVLGLWEPTIIWLAGILESLSNRMKFISGIRFRPTFCASGISMTRKVCCRQYLHQRNDPGYMELARVDVSTFDWIVYEVSRTSPQWPAKCNGNPRFNLNAALCIAAAAESVAL